MEKRYIIEIGTGLDLHGGDVTKATIKAVKDAMSHSCLCGISELLELDDPSKMKVRIKIACPHPERVDQNAVLAVLPGGNGIIEEILEGGLSTQGLHVDVLGAGDQIVVSVVSLTVWIEM